MRASALDPAIPAVLVLEPDVAVDDRGMFFEARKADEFSSLTGVGDEFVQENQSHSRRGVLRGLHYQLPPFAQGKLVRVTRGAVFDVVVDVRRSSAHFGSWAGIQLSDSNLRQLWVPPGFAHGFVALGDGADVAYKLTGPYAPASERVVRWNDPAIGIDWPIDADPMLSDRDRRGPLLADVDVFEEEVGRAAATRSPEELP